MVKNSPANAGDMGSSPGLGRSHMRQSNSACASQLLSLCSRAHEPQLLKLIKAYLKSKFFWQLFWGTGEIQGRGYYFLLFLLLVFFNRVLVLPFQKQKSFPTRNRKMV